MSVRPSESSCYGGADTAVLPPTPMARRAQAQMPSVAMQERNALPGSVATQKRPGPKSNPRRCRHASPNPPTVRRRDPPRPRSDPTRRCSHSGCCSRIHARSADPGGAGEARSVPDPIRGGAGTRGAAAEASNGPELRGNADETRQSLGPTLRGDAGTLGAAATRSADTGDADEACSVPDPIRGGAGTKGAAAESSNVFELRGNADETRHDTIRRCRHIGCCS